MAILPILGADGGDIGKFPGHHEAMSASLEAELSSISGTTDSIRQRISELTHSAGARANEELLATLYEAERSLASAERHLARARRLS